MKEENERFKKVRLKTGKNQVEFADLIERPQSYISAIEHGRKPLTYELLEVLLRKLDVNPAYLIVGEPYEMYMAEQKTTSNHPDMLLEEVEKVEYKKEGLVEKELKRLEYIESASLEFRKKLQALSKKSI